MCGIAGFYGGGTMEDLRAMTDALRLRGPDAEGHEVIALPDSGPVLLGHRRLSVVDIAGGDQPMYDRDRQLCIVFNGEIYNHLDIRRDLEQRGNRFATSHSDTETLLASYREYGEACVDHLNGMFAFVILDRARQRLFGARDRFGEKPLYYCHDGDFFAFASEMKSLQQHSMVPRSIDQTALIKLLAYGFVPAPLSLVRGIRKLEPGVSFTFDLRSREFASKRYYRYANQTDDSLEKANVNDIADEVLSLLSASVKRRLMSDVPLGVLLSGGLDSSLITALMTAHTDAPVKSFSIGFEEPSYDERVHSAFVAKKFGDGPSTQPMPHGGADRPCAGYPGPPRRAVLRCFPVAHMDGLPRCPQEGHRGSIRRRRRRVVRRLRPVRGDRRGASGA